MNIVERVAQRYNEKPENVRKEMEMAMDFLYQDETKREKLNQYFPEGKPTIEEFIMKLTQMVASEYNSD